MKKNKWPLLLALILLLTLGLAHVALAASPTLLVDGIKPAPLVDDNPYLLDAAPEMKNNTVFVPLRFITELLGAEVSWQGDEAKAALASQRVELKYGDTTLQLTVGSRTAQRNGQSITLPAAPYEKNGRTMVPLRFISENFGCQVDWANNQVDVRLAPWQLKNYDVIGLSLAINMNTDAMIYPTKSPLLARKIYQTALAGLGQEVVAPENFGSHIQEFPTADYCFLDSTYYLLTEETLAADAIAIYNGSEESEWLVNMAGKWYTITQEAKDQLYLWFNVLENSREDHYIQYELAE